MQPIDSSWKGFGVYRPARLFEPDSYEHWAVLHSASTGSWGAIELEGGEELRIPTDGSWSLAPLTPGEIEERYGISWPTDQLGRPVRGAEMWPDPWWDQRNRNPVFAAVLALQKRYKLPFDEGLEWLSCQMAKRKPEARPRRWRNEPVFLASQVAKLVTEGVDSQSALHYCVTEQVREKSVWHYTEFKPRLAPATVWRRSGWATASQELPEMIASCREQIARRERSKRRAKGRAQRAPPARVGKRPLSPWVARNFLCSSRFA